MSAGSANSPGKVGGTGGDVHRSERSRHLVIRLAGGEVLPDALVAKLQDEGVTAGWLRASGVLTDVVLRTFDGRGGLPGRLGGARLVAGPVQAVVLEGAIGTAGGSVACTLRAVLACEGDAGHEIFAGEIQTARAIGVEIVVTSLANLALERATDPATGVVLFERSKAGTVPASSGAGTWTSALAASDERDPHRGAAASGPARMPQKPARQAVDFDEILPETGDVVDHFAFGRCEVVKSDGDRLHLRVPKDTRIKEIALEMLRVTPLEDLPGEGEDGPRRRFRLDRKM